jgi:hypothetical protein
MRSLRGFAVKIGAKLDGIWVRNPFKKPVPALRTVFRMFNGVNDFYGRPGGGDVMDPDDVRTL